MSASARTLLKGGHLIDPHAGTNAKRDIAVAGTTIAEIGTDLIPQPGDTVIDVQGRIVLPGLIDTHAHVYQYVSGRFGLNPDMVGVQSGVTTIVDQGGPSCMTFPGFRKFIVEPSDTRVLAFLSAYVVGGLEGHYYPDLYSPTGVDVGQTIRIGQANSDLVKGIKAHAEIGGFQRWGLEVIKLSKQISSGLKVPLYIHFGQLWPTPEKPSVDFAADDILPAVVELLDPGDVLAHPFTRHPGGFVNQQGELHPAVREALAKGVKTDVGHGSHFSFDMARKVIDAGVIPDTMGADMHGYNTKVPAPAGSPEEHTDEEHMFAGEERFSLVHAMNALMALGLSLDQVVPMVTSNCAAMLGMTDEIGTLRAGGVADITVLTDQRGRWQLKDNAGASVTAERMLQPEFCLRSGMRFDATAPILPVPKAMAA